MKLFSDLFSESLTIQQAYDVYGTFDANHFEILGHLGENITSQLSGPFQVLVDTKFSTGHWDHAILIDLAQRINALTLAA